MTMILFALTSILLPTPDGEPINYPAVATAQAQRLTPPAPEPVFEFSTESDGASCTGALPWLVALSPGWDPNRMARYMFRESRCLPDSHNSAGAQGLLQITRVNYPYLSRQLGEPVNDQWLRNPVNNIRAAAVMYLYWGGYQPWTCCT